MLTRLSTKGQLIIPKEIRERHGWRPGSQIEVEDHRDVVVLRPARGVPRVKLEDLVGCTGYEGPRLSLADMEEAIARGARERR